MERVTGLGGVFIRSAQPDRLEAWYAEHLGANEPFISGDRGEVTVFAVFAEDDDYFDGPVMLNFRVSDLDAMLDQLRAGGVRVDERVEDYEYGRFGWGYDCDGNRFELWEPSGGTA